MATPSLHSKRLPQGRKKNFGNQYYPPLIVVSSDQPSFGFLLLTEYFPNILQWKRVGKAWGLYQGSPELWTWENPNSPEAKLDPGVSSSDTWATCSDLFTTSPAAAAHNSWFTDFFSNNKNIQITFLWEMFFTPRTSVINDFNHKINSAHLCNYLRIFPPTCFSA